MYLHISMVRNKQTKIIFDKLKLKYLTFVRPTTIKIKII